MGCTAQAWVERSNATSDKRFSLRGEFVTVEMSFSQFSNQQIDEGQVELGDHQQFHVLDASPVYKIAVHQYPAWGLYDANSMTTHFRVHFADQSGQIDFVHQAKDPHFAEPAVGPELVLFRHT